MHRRLRALLAGACLVLSPQLMAQDMKPIAYPETRRGTIVETQFGEKIADPYRWLENDVRTDPEVADWVARENAVTQGYLAGLPQRAWFETRIRELMNYERFGLPEKAGRRYFYTRNSGLQNQAQLFVRQGLRGKPRLLLDPNAWAGDQATALDDWKPSKDGRLLLYSVQDGGTDWRVLKLLDVRTGQPLKDEIHWAKFTDLAWIGSDGFLYSRFPTPQEGQTFQQRNYDQAIYYHRVGTPQEADELVYATPDHPEYGHSAQVTEDGNYVIITSSIGTDAKNEVHMVDLPMRKRPGWPVQALVRGFDNDWRLVGNLGPLFWFITNKDAPRAKLVAINLLSATSERIDCRLLGPDMEQAGGCARLVPPSFFDVVPESAETLENARIVGDKMILSYLKDAASHAVVYDLAGKPARILSLNGIGTASGFKGRLGDPETFYSFTSFNQPAAVYRLDLATGRTTPFAEPKLTFDPHDYDVDQQFYRSKDGTKVPVFIVRKKSVVAAKQAVPTLLYGYGGFDVSLTPTFSSVRMAWLEAGGAFAMANLRGGGEYGKEWHDGGRLANKQNAFDDFIAAGEYLVDHGIAPKRGLAIQGGSNGGLLVGAVVNQRPDLFAAANAAVGVMDMLRFDRFTAGRYWVDDYGHPDREADFRVLRAYSPYHNIKKSTPYPAMLVTTADTDDRVVPGHSFKYAAALQAAGVGPKPQLIRIETRAGHGSGKPTDKQIEEGADVLGFLAQWTGLKPR